MVSDQVIWVILNENIGQWSCNMGDFKWKCWWTWDSMESILKQRKQLTQCWTPHPSSTWSSWILWGWWWFLWWWFALCWKPPCDEDRSSKGHVEAAKEQVGDREVDDEDRCSVPHLMMIMRKSYDWNHYENYHHQWRF